jgi:ATP-dependent Lon protease, bacterial type
MKLPYIAIKKQVIFPYSTDSIKVGKARSVEAFEYAKNNNPKATRLVIVFLNENADNSNKISLKDIYQNGVLATVTKSSKKNSI